MYRRPPPPNRRFIPAQAIDAITPQPVKEEHKKIVPELNTIPLPNEVESGTEHKPDRKRNPFAHILNQIHIDDLILLGLVFLLISEGLNEAEDDFLIVILLYLFIAGRK